MFLPAFVNVGVTAKFLPKLRKSAVASAFLDGVSAAAAALMAVVGWQFARAAIVNLPAIVLRAIRITEKLNLQVRAEAFNALNHTNLGTPNRYVNEPQFGTITMTMTPGRQIQLSARLSF